MLDRIVVYVALSCVLASSATAADSNDAACFADAVPKLRLVSSVPNCNDTPKTCVDACGADALDQCLGAAYAHQHRGELDAAHTRFREACLLGSANACTNFGASIWSGAVKGYDLSCALGLFRKACGAGEHFACGMMGRLAFEQAESGDDFAAVRRDLEAACETVGGFSCRVLARQLETGKLGAHSEADVARLLSQACRQGDPDACGKPATATETFE